MDDLLKYFGAAYLINLRERKDRLASATKEFARAQWEFGSRGVQLYVAQRFADRAGFPSPGVRGCFYSHWGCLRAAHSQGQKSVLVMEDDIALSSSLQKLTPAIISRLESNPWDILYLGHEGTGKIKRATSGTTEIRLIPFKGEIRGCHFYAVNGRVFGHLLDHLERVAGGKEGDQQFGPMPIDGALNIFRRTNPDVVGLIATPKLGWQKSSRSELAPRFFDSFQLARPLINVFRNVKNASMRWRS
jgi:GR25 family glycosyltransferase involved in LPS biosynthesis